MLITLLVLMMLYASWAPSSGVGRLLHGFSEAACRRMARLKPLTVILFVIFVAALGALVAYAKMEGLMMAVPAGADGLAFFAAIDVGTYVEVLAAAWLLSAGGALRTALQGLRTLQRLSRLRLGRPRRARRAPRASVTRRPRTGLGDEDEPAAWPAPLWTGYAT